MTNQAYHAIRAANHREEWGPFSARQYANRWSTPRLYRIARQCLAMNKINGSRRND